MEKLMANKGVGIILSTTFGSTKALVRQSKHEFNSHPNAINKSNRPSEDWEHSRTYWEYTLSFVQLVAIFREKK